MDSDVRALQNKILEMAVYLDEICQKHGIRYYLFGGSALGAVRHQGFIPWDDDFDVCMTYDHYMKFIQVCRKDLDTKRFYLQEEGTQEWPLYFTKLRMNGTAYIEVDTEKRKMHKGVFVDIFCLNNAAENIFLHRLQYVFGRMLVAATLAERGYITKSKKKKLAMFFSKIFIRGKLKTKLLNFVRSFNDRATTQVGDFIAGGKFKYTTFPRDYLGVPRYVNFSTAKLPVPEQVEKYLTFFYGDYMKLPDEKARHSTLHALYVDLGQSLE